MKNFTQKIALVVLLIFVICSLALAQDNRNVGVRQSVKSESRLALVIGNGTYQNTDSLANPANDATDMASILKELGFEVILGTNQSLSQMRKLLREFGAKLKQNGGVGLFYYAGHGVQVNGRNFLIPVDADIANEVETEDVALDLNSALRQMDAAGNGFNIVILDACRNNPFARSWNRNLGSGGLAQVSAPNGTFIAYSTAPDRTASDGTGRNGLYTSELLKHLKQSDLKIEEVFKEVTKSVNRISSGNQTPWVSSSLRGDFYFLGTGKNRPTSTGTITNSDPSTSGNNYDSAQFFEIARAYLNKGDFDRALIEINKAIEISPRYVNAYVLRAGIYSIKNQHTKVIEDCTKAIEFNSNSEYAYSIRGYSYNVIGEFDSALKDFNRALEINPQLGVAYSGRGVYYSNIKDYRRALTDMTQGIKLGSVDAQNYYNRGLVYANLGDYDNALADLSKAIEINPNFAIAYNGRAAVYERKGDKVRAEADKKKYLKLIGVE